MTTNTPDFLAIPLQSEPFGQGDLSERRSSRLSPVQQSWALRRSLTGSLSPSSWENCWQQINERFEKLGYRRPFRRIGEKLLRLNRRQPHFRCGLSGPAIALIVNILMDVTLLTLLSQVMAGILEVGLALDNRIASRWIGARSFGATARPRDGRPFLASSHCDLRIIGAATQDCRLPLKQMRLSTFAS